MTATLERMAAESETRVHLSANNPTRIRMMMASKSSRTRIKREEMVGQPKGRDNKINKEATPKMALTLPRVASEATEVAEVAEADSSKTPDAMQQSLPKIENTHT